MPKAKDRIPKRITPGLERFCLALLGGMTQPNAYRAAFRVSPQTKATSVHRHAQKLASYPIVKARLAELMAPAIARATISFEEWLQWGLTRLKADPGKMFDSHNNPIPIRELGDSERLSLVSFEQTEEFIGKAENMIPSGYTRKYKMLDPVKLWVEIGKAKKFTEGESGDGEKATKHYTLTFRSAPNLPPPVTVELAPTVPKVKFVSSH